MHVLEVDLVEDVSGKTIKMRDIGCEAISELSLEGGVLQIAGSFKSSMTSLPIMSSVRPIDRS